MTSPLPFAWARWTLAALFVAVVGVVSCGRIAEPRVCLDVVVDTVWGYNDARTDSIAALVTTCAEWDR